MIKSSSFLSTYSTKIDDEDIEVCYMYDLPLHLVKTSIIFNLAQCSKAVQTFKKSSFSGSSSPAQTVMAACGVFLYLCKQSLFLYISQPNNVYIFRCECVGFSPEPLCFSSLWKQIPLLLSKPPLPFLFHSRILLTRQIVCRVDETLINYSLSIFYTPPI